MQGSLGRIALNLPSVSTLRSIGSSRLAFLSFLRSRVWRIVHFVAKLGIRIEEQVDDVVLLGIIFISPAGHGIQ